MRVVVEVGVRTISVAVTTAECTKEEFRNGVVSGAKKDPRVVGWYDPYSPILDVTNTVKAVKANVKSARLTIFGSNLDAIRVEGPYDSLPPALSADQVVANWEKGEEWERQRCPKNDKYYWVIYPCRLDVEYEVAPPEEERPAPSPWLQMWQLLRGLFPFLPEEPPIAPPTA